MQCGICDKDMFGKSESPDGLIICGSCIMAPLPPPPEDDLDKDQIPDVGHDLSYLSQEGQKDAARGKLKKSKSVWQVQMETGQMVLQQSTPLQEGLPVKMLKLKSNSVRDRNHPVGSLMLRFDGDGVAEFAEHHLAEVKRHMTLRPGRYRLLNDEKPVPKKDPHKALEDARAALVAARVKPEPEPTPEPEPVLDPEPGVLISAKLPEPTPEPAPEPEPEPEQPVVKPKPKPKPKPRAKKKSSTKKSEEA